MALLGELLLAAGVLDQEALEQALRAQVMWGGRLGTNLVELGLLSLDELSTALGRQHHLPAALASHFERADRELLQKLSPDVAERCGCMPLVRAGKRIVITSMEPLDDKATEIVARELAIDPDKLIPSIAAELRFRFYLERHYGIPREQRFRRSRGTESQASTFQPLPGETNPPVQVPAAAIAMPEPIVLDEPAGPAPDTRDPTIERRTYVQTLADRTGPAEAPTATDAPPPREAPVRPSRFAILTATPAEVIATIEDARDRDEVAELVIGSVARFVPECRAALLLVVRGEAATSWTSFCRDRSDLPALAVPLDQHGLVSSAHRRNAITRASSGNLGPIDYMLLASLGVPYGDLIVAPIAIGDHVRCMIVIATAPNGAAPMIGDLAAAAGAAFARLMRDASRKHQRPG